MLMINFKQRKSIFGMSLCHSKGHGAHLQQHYWNSREQPQLPEQGATGVLLKECIGTRLKTILP